MMSNEKLKRLLLVAV